jgi:hypothetical protein
MTTGESQDLGTLEATEFHVPRLLRAAEVLCSDGRLLRGRVFLPATAESHPGAMRAEEWMNDPASFFPFLPDGEGRPVILNKDQVAVMTVSASADHDETLEQLKVPVKPVRVECGSTWLEGEVVVDMPVNQLRILDVLNRPGAFLNVREGGRHHLVRKAGITRVSEPAPARPRP